MINIHSQPQSELLKRDTPILSSSQPEAMEQPKKLQRKSVTLRKNLALSALVLCLLSAAPRIVKADEEAGVDYYDPELDSEDLAERLADMPDSALNIVDPAVRQRFVEKYGKRPFQVSVDSIEPEGGPTTGQTRVLVRGGPF